MKKILIFAAMLLNTPYLQAGENYLNQIAQSIQNNVQLQKGLKNCPADYKVFNMDQALHIYVNEQNLCKTDQKSCYSACLNNNAGACYFLALDLQAINKNQQAEALFQKGCEAGLAIACTNRASGIQFYAGQMQQQISPQQSTCISTAFKNACQAQDPWGCTMFGQKLYEGQGVAKNISQALKVLDLSCQYGATTDACQHAGMLKKMILNLNK